jgi:hypothetical protein
LEVTQGKEVAELLGKKFLFHSSYEQKPIPFNIIGLGELKDFPLKVQTWNGRNCLTGKLMGKVTCSYNAKIILNFIENGQLTKKQ